MLLNLHWTQILLVVFCTSAVVLATQIPFILNGNTPAPVVGLSEAQLNAAAYSRAKTAMGYAAFFGLGCTVFFASYFVLFKLFGLMVKAFTKKKQVTFLEEEGRALEKSELLKATQARERLEKAELQKAAEAREKLEKQLHVAEVESKQLRKKVRDTETQTLALPAKHMKDQGTSTDSVRTLRSTPSANSLSSMASSFPRSVGLPEPLDFSVFTPKSVRSSASFDSGDSPERSRPRGRSGSSTF